MINILIVHYNTPTVTRALIKSIKKYVKEPKIFIFENSDSKPLTNLEDDIVVFDNSNGDIIDFNAWLCHFPNRVGSPCVKNNFASAKHCYSIERCFDLIPDGFVLLDSDVLVKGDVGELVDCDSCFVGTIGKKEGNYERVLPFCCYINVPLCRSLGIHYFNPRYIMGLLVSGDRDADNYDTGAYFLSECNHFPHKEINYRNYADHLGKASWKNGNSITQFIDKRKNLINKNKKVVYTCVSGNYDCLSEPRYTSDDFDYVCFCDGDLNTDVWEKRDIPEKLSGLSDVKRARYIKLHPHEFFPEYELSVWVDANVDLCGDINEYINEKCSDCNHCVFIGKHPCRDCIYDEALECIRRNKDIKENIDPQISRYRQEGFPKHYGLTQTGIMIRKHNNKKCIDIMEAWWGEIENGSHRDQLSLSYVLWKLNETICELDKSIFNCKTFKLISGHRNTTAKKTNAIAIQPKNEEKRITQSSSKGKTKHRSNPMQF